MLVDAPFVLALPTELTSGPVPGVAFCVIRPTLRSCEGEGRPSSAVHRCLRLTLGFQVLSLR